MRKTTFEQVVEMADHLSLDEQETLVEVLRRRAIAQRRARLVRDVASANRDYARGACRRVSPDEVMREILQ
ncbi:MAG: hypothetical protein ACHRHE_07830 [Tepidisphaerales bacterium]